MHDHTSCWPWTEPQSPIPTRIASRPPQNAADIAETDPNGLSMSTLSLRSTIFDKTSYMLTTEQGGAKGRRQEYPASSSNFLDTDGSAFLCLKRSSKDSSERHTSRSSAFQGGEVCQQLLQCTKQQGSMKNAHNVGQDKNAKVPRTSSAQYT